MNYIAILCSKSGKIRETLPLIVHKFSIKINLNTSTAKSWCASWRTALQSRMQSFIAYQIYFTQIRACNYNSYTKWSLIYSQDLPICCKNLELLSLIWSEYSYMTHQFDFVLLTLKFYSICNAVKSSYYVNNILKST